MFIENKTTKGHDMSAHYTIKIDGLTKNNTPVFTDMMTHEKAIKEVAVICTMFGINESNFEIIDTEAMFSDC